MIHPALHLAPVPGKGRGVFSRIPLKAGTITEISPVIVMDAEDRRLLDQTRLHDYIFEWQPGGRNMCCMALGYVPMYNHSYTANCEYFMDYEKETITVKTVREVAEGEELTINYNGDWNDPSEVWFAAKAD
jgi:SET domain-containing protein